MTFYSDGTSHYSHRVRIVLAEKGVTVETIDVDPDNKPEDLASLNPYNPLPTLVDRDLVLYEADIMMEYLDERFPHPPLFPVYPVARAESRLWIYRIRRDWCAKVDALMANSGMSDQFAIVDCCVAPILWRLPVMGIELPKNKTTKPLLDYRDRLFERDSVLASFSEQEKEMV